MVEGQLARFLRDNWAVVSVLLVALAFALFMASRLFLDFLYFNDPENVDVDLKPWMTPRFIVMTYDLPRPFVFELFELDPDTDSGLRLGRIAERDNITMEELTARVRDAAETYRSRQE